MNGKNENFYLKGGKISMKKLIVGILALVVAVGFVGCNTANQEEIKVLNDSITVLNQKIEELNIQLDELQPEEEVKEEVKKEIEKKIPKKEVVKKKKI